MRRHSSIISTVVLLGLIGFFVYGMLAPKNQNFRRARRSTTTNNLRKLVLAMHNYHDQFGCFPPAYVAGEDGQPMHSWRVLILPYLGYDQLYGRYDFNQPWNSEHNNQLLDEMPREFESPADDSDSKFWSWLDGLEPRSRYTRFVAIRGAATAFEGDRGAKLQEFRDGVSQTILLTQCPANLALWTEPVDFSTDQWFDLFNDVKSGKRDAQQLSRYGLAIGLADGSTRALPWVTPRETLKALTTKSFGDDPGHF